MVFWEKLTQLEDCSSLSKAMILQVIDFEPEEPVRRGDRQHQSGRRKRITRVLLLVLQVVNSELACQQNRSETRSQAVTFVARHSRMMQRVLREAAIGNLNGWEPGEQEAELAALVLSLVTQLSFGQLSQQPGAPAGRQTLVACCVIGFINLLCWLHRSTQTLPV